MLSTPNLLVWLALLASLVLVAQYRPVIFPVIAFIASLFEALMMLHVLQISVSRVPLGLVFGIMLLIAGVGTIIRAGAKSTISAATAVALVGALQTLANLHLH